MYGKPNFDEGIAILTGPLELDVNAPLAAGAVIRTASGSEYRLGTPRPTGAAAAAP